MTQLYTPNALVKGIKATLLQSLARATSALLGTIAMLQPSESDDEDYAWLGEPPRMRQLDDDDQLQYEGMSDTLYSVANDIWAVGVKISRKMYDDQKENVIRKRIQQLAVVGTNHINRMIINGLINGDVRACYDGDNFFDDDHDARGQQTAVQDNLMAGSGTTTAQCQTDIGDAVETILSFVSENNEPFTEDVRRIAVVHPVGISRQIVEATKAGIIANTSNTMKEQFEILTIPSARLTADDVNDYYVLDISNPDDLPLILQERDGLEVTHKMDGDDAFDNEIYKFKIRWRGALAFGHWQRAVKVVNS